VEKRPGFNRILLAVNGSEHSSAAVAVAAAIAGQSHAEVLVLHVWNSGEDPLEHDDEMSRRRNDETNVSSIVDRLRKAGVSATGESEGATYHAVAASIGRRADSFDADLVVVGNRGLAELHTFLIGSRTRQVMAEANRPVLAVRNVGRQRGGRLGRVVLVLNGSGDFAGLVEACLDVAQPASAQVEVVHFGDRNGKAISGVADQLARHGVTPTWRHVGGNQAADEILDVAHHLTADILVVGATSPGDRWPLAAGVMNRLLQSCPCPLLVVPTAELAKTRGATLTAPSVMRPQAV
jgi:nucleotide-binding universal stress UspA family protein